MSLSTENDAKWVQAGVTQGWWRPTATHLPYYCREMLFRGIDFKGRSFFDIGCGNGGFLAWAELNGAADVLGIEPQAAGSQPGAAARFEQLKRSLALSKVRIEFTTVQEFDISGNCFDILFLHNSINHLDEPACISLLTDAAAQQAYVGIFEKLRKLTRKGGKLVLADCDRRNFFADIGVRNPIARSIEWHKHQSPAVWIRLAEAAGFGNADLLWTSLPRYRDWTRALRNRVGAYFLNSHYRIILEAL